MHQVQATRHHPYTSNTGVCQPQVQGTLEKEVNVDNFDIEEDTTNAHLLHQNLQRALQLSHVRGKGHHSPQDGQPDLQELVPLEDQKTTCRRPILHVPTLWREGHTDARIGM